MSMVHGSGGINMPASPELKSEVKIIAGIARETVGSAALDWDDYADDTAKIRDLIAEVLPLFGAYNDKLHQPGGFRLRNTARERIWNTPTARARFAAPPLPEATDWQRVQGRAQSFVLQTLRSHDQYNTTVYGHADRYRGIKGERDVVFVHPQDIRDLGAVAGDRVDLIGAEEDGVERRARGFKLIAYDIPRGCLAGYYPELNVLVPHTSYGAGSYTPTSKSIAVRVQLADND